MNVEFNPEAVLRAAEDEARRRLTKAAILLSNAVKETLSVPAPRRLSRVSYSRVAYYVARTRAAPGAPPRKLSGALRRSVAWEVRGRGTDLVARVGSNLVYARAHEKGRHPFLAPTLAAKAAELGRVLAGG